MGPVEMATWLRYLENDRINEALNQGWVPSIDELTDVWFHYLEGESVADLIQVIRTLYFNIAELHNLTHLRFMNGLIEGMALNWMNSDDQITKYVVIYTYGCITDECEVLGRLYYTCAPVRSKQDFCEEIRKRSPGIGSVDWILVTKECYDLLVSLEIARIIDAPEDEIEKNRVCHALYKMCEKFLISQSEDVNNDTTGTE